MLLKVASSGEKLNALSNLLQQSIGRLPGADENLQLARTFPNLSGQVDQPESDRFEPLASPALLKGAPFSPRQSVMFNLAHELAEAFVSLQLLQIGNAVTTSQIQIGR